MRLLILGFTLILIGACTSKNKVELDTIGYTGYSHPFKDERIIKQFEEETGLKYEEFLKGYNKDLKKYSKEAMKKSN